MLAKRNKNDSLQLKVINISHGDGGLKTGELINRFILKYLKNEILEKLEKGEIDHATAMKMINDLK